MSVKTIDDRTYQLDAREIDGEPFTDIMAALERVGEDETLVLINSFEPTPLFEVLEQRGFTHETTEKKENEWHVTISRR